MIEPRQLAAALDRAAAEDATAIRVAQCAVAWLDRDAAQERYKCERLLMEWAVDHPDVRITRLLRHDLPGTAAGGGRKRALDQWIESAVAWAALLGPDADERLTILRIVDDRLCDSIRDGVTWQGAAAEHDRPDDVLDGIGPGSTGTTRTRFTEFSHTHTADFDEAQIYASIASL